MSRPHPLSRIEARRSLAQRLAPRVDRIRQLSTRFGLRSRRVFLVWTKFTGAERGEGREREIRRIELLPTPKVSDLTSLALTPYAAGILPVGSIRLDYVSALLSEELLRGKLPPADEKIGAPIEEPFSFFYELVEDERTSDAPARAKFRLFGTPWRKEGDVKWNIVLERISEDRRPDGSSQLGDD